MLWNNDKRKEMEKKGAKWMYKQLSVGKNIKRKRFSSVFFYSNAILWLYIFLWSKYISISHKIYYKKKQLKT